MQTNQINQMSEDIKKIIAKESEGSLKIKGLEQEINKISNYFSRPFVEIALSTRQKS